MTARRRVTGVAVLLVGWGSTAASAQVPTGPDPGALGGISVYGNGEVRNKANLLEIDLRVAGAAELSGDAVVKYRDAKRRTTATLANLKLKNLEIEETGLAVAGTSSAEQMQMMMRGMPSPAGKSQTEISRTLRLRVSGIQDLQEDQLMEMIGKLLDGAKDSGAIVGLSAEEMNMAYRYGSPVRNATVRFVLTNFGQLRERAYELAVADARSRAERLAKLHAVKLGRVILVQEMQVAGDQAGTVSQPRGDGMSDQPEPAGQQRIVSDRFALIPISVRLLVRFAIAPENTRTAGN